MSSKLTIKLVRSFSLGFKIFSPKLNGLCIEVSVGCFAVQLWSRGKTFFAAKNYWNG